MPARVIDPDDVFAEDGAWAGREEAGPPVAWRICGRHGEVEAEGCSIEVVDGMLHVLDANEDVLLALPPSAWERVEAVSGRIGAAGGRAGESPPPGEPGVRDAA
ncbi:hypothetical protein [Arenibaculum sp.]|uniref:hypothetical protein n=1 Tax=Arenibaculum sp. TaxID=2865862 RepID=UPI002E10D32C|nr:hypothetical protein [Arenibaculum sp.]